MSRYWTTIAPTLSRRTPSRLRIADILRNLQRSGVIRAIPTSLTKKQYLRIEKRFGQFAKHIGIPLDELDLLFWSLEPGMILK